MRVGVLGIGKTPHKIQHDKSLRDLIVDAGRIAMDDAGVDRVDERGVGWGVRVRCMLWEVRCVSA